LSVAFTAARENPHAPRISGWRRLLGPFYVTGVFWYRFHAFGVRILPEWGFSVAITLFASFFLLVLGNIRRAIASNLEAVLGPCGFLERQRRVFRTIRIFSWCLSERYERLVTDHPFRIDAAGEEIWRDITRSGRGLIMLTAHLGSWEVGSMMPATRDQRAVHLVREAEGDPKAQAFISKLLEGCGGDLYTTHFAADPELGFVLLEALRRGEVVALQGDRPRAGGRTCPTALFGRPFPLPMGTAVLARAAEVPIVPIFVFREGRRHYRCVIHDPIEVARTDDRRQDVQEALAQYTQYLEAAIRQNPHQWFCFREIW
jgi:lauroyl/myristoyl acyltransferase